jgi:antibiotic biosynthesis monooxygenase (ABM) superfamily enzyme
MVRPDRQADYESWLKGITAEAAKFDGYLGSDVIRPTDHRHPEYVVIFRFADYDGLRAWQASQVRRDWMDRSNDIAVQDTHTEVFSGAEYWFTAPAAPRPSRYRQAVVTWLALYPLITVILLLAGPTLAELSIYLRTLVVSVTLVVLMTFVVMPYMTRWFAGWLFPAKK